MEKHGLLERGWTFHFDNALRRIGQCRYREKEIGYSTPCIWSSWESITDTILHEIAHALLRPKTGHNWEWKAKARELGCDPYAVTEDFSTTAKPTYKIECPKCKRRWYRHRMRKRNYGSRCPACHVEVKIYQNKAGYNQVYN